MAAAVGAAFGGTLVVRVGRQADAGHAGDGGSAIGDAFGGLVHEVRDGRPAGDDVGQGDVGAHPEGEPEIVLAVGALVADDADRLQQRAAVVLAVPGRHVRLEVGHGVGIDVQENAGKMPLDDAQGEDAVSIEQLLVGHGQAHPRFGHPAALVGLEGHAGGLDVAAAHRFLCHVVQQLLGVKVAQGAFAVHVVGEAAAKAGQVDGSHRDAGAAEFGRPLQVPPVVPFAVLHGGAETALHVHGHLVHHGDGQLAAETVAVGGVVVEEVEVPFQVEHGQVGVEADGIQLPLHFAHLKVLLDVDHAPDFEACAGADGEGALILLAQAAEADPAGDGQTDLHLFRVHRLHKGFYGLQAEAEAAEAAGGHIAVAVGGSAAHGLLRRGPRPVADVPFKAVGLDPAVLRLLVVVVAHPHVLELDQREVDRQAELVEVDVDLAVHGQVDFGLLLLIGLVDAEVGGFVVEVHFGRPQIQFERGVVHGDVEVEAVAGDGAVVEEVPAEERQAETSLDVPHLVLVLFEIQPDGVQREFPAAPLVGLRTENVAGEDAGAEALLVDDQAAGPEMDAAARVVIVGGVGDGAVDAVFVHHHRILGGLVVAGGVHKGVADVVRKEHFAQVPVEAGPLLDFGLQLVLVLFAEIVVGEFGACGGAFGGVVIVDAVA